MGFYKPLQALVLAIVIFLVVRLYNSALTYSRYALKQVMGFCKLLQALVLAIVVFLVVRLYNPALTFATLRSKASDGVFVNPYKLSACNCYFCWLLHTHAML